MIYIGIDPDVDKSGYGVYCTDQKKIIDYGLKNMFTLVDFIRNYKTESLHVIIEAGFLNKKSNYHTTKNQSKEVGEKIANSVGRNHQVSRMIGEAMDHYNVSYSFSKPAEKKVTPFLFKVYTGIEVKNQEIIDACMMVFGRKIKLIK